MTTADLAALDWRFLLPAPGSAAVTVLDPRGGTGRAAEGTPPGGALCVTVSSRRQRRRWRVALGAAGTADVCQYWLVPDARRPRAAVPLHGGAVAAAAALGRAAGPRKAALVRLAARAAATTRTLPLLARHVLLVAAPGSARPGLCELVMTATGGGAPLQVTLLSPRYPSSRHALGLLVTPDDGLRYVAKVARQRGDGTALRHEAAMLTRLAGSELAGSVPRLVALDDLDGHPVLVQTAVRGDALNVRRARHYGGALLAAGACWSARAPLTGRSGGEWYDGYVTRPLQVLRAQPAVDPSAVERARAMTASLARAGLPLVLEHGDLREGNVLHRRDGIAVVDWETGRPDGMPAADLAVFGAYLAAASAGDRSPAAVASAVAASFGPSGAGRAAVGEELAGRGLPRQLAAAVVPAALARHAAALLDRLAAAGAPADAAAGEIAAWQASLASLADLATA